MKLARREDDDEAIGLVAVRFGANSRHSGQRVVDDFPIACRHGLKFLTSSCFSCPCGGCVSHSLECLDAPLQVTLDIDRDDRPNSGLLRGDSAGKFLKSAHRRPVTADQNGQVIATNLCSDPRRGWRGLHIGVNRHHIEETLEKSSYGAGLPLGLSGIDLYRAMPLRFAMLAVERVVLDGSLIPPADEDSRLPTGERILVPFRQDSDLDLVFSGPELGEGGVDCILNRPTGDLDPVNHAQRRFFFLP